jgi:hypothetical protein
MLDRSSRDLTLPPPTHPIPQSPYACIRGLLEILLLPPCANENEVLLFEWEGRSAGPEEIVDGEADWFVMPCWA